MAAGVEDRYPQMTADTRPSEENPLRYHLYVLYS